MTFNEFGFYEGQLVYWSDIEKETVGPVFYAGKQAYRNAYLVPNGRFENAERLVITVDWSLKPYIPVDRTLTTGAGGLIA